MEECFANSQLDSENNDNALELQRWQQWQDTEPAGLHTATQTGSAARPIEIDGAAARTTATTPHRRGKEGGDTPLEETETLWGHAVHEHELSLGDQVGRVSFAHCLYVCSISPTATGRLLFPLSLICCEVVSLVWPLAFSWTV